MSETGLTNGDFTEANEPYALFEAWLAEAAKAEINDPNGMALATVDQDGLPNIRMVLLKGHDERGFVFYTNFESAKGREILASMKAGAAVPLEIAAPPGPHPRHCRSGDRRRSRRILRLPPAPQSASAHGHPNSRARSKAVSRWKRQSPNSPQGTRSAKSPARPTGPAFASSRSKSSSGKTAPSACTTASSSKRLMAAGRSRGFIREVCLNGIETNGWKPRSDFQPDLWHWQTDTRLPHELARIPIRALGTRHNMPPA